MRTKTDFISKDSVLGSEDTIRVNFPPNYTPRFHSFEEALAEFNEGIEEFDSLIRKLNQHVPLSEHKTETKKG